MKGWNFVALGSLADFKNGLNYSKENFGSGLKVIGVSDFKDFNFPRYSDLDEINPEGVVREQDLLLDGDFVFVRSNGNRELIGRCLLIDNPPFLISHSGFTIRARFHPGAIEKKFYLYCFKTHIIMSTLHLYGGGANISNLNQSILSKLTVPLPPLPIQRKIAAVLSEYDDLIENNNRRIALLEKLGEDLYREWFVRLRFPGHESTKIVRGVPEGWKVKRIEELIQRIPVGKRYDINTVSPVGSVPVLDQSKAGILGYHNKLPGVIASDVDPIITFANHTCHQRLVFHHFSTIQNVLPYKSIESIGADIYWLFFATKGLVEISEYKGHWPEFANKQVFFPGKDATCMFGDFVRPAMIEAYKLRVLNSRITDIRDRLLTRLMSGKIDLESLDIAFPPSMQEAA